MSAASRLSTSDQLIAPAFFTRAPDAGFSIGVYNTQVRPPPSRFVPAFARRSSPGANGRRASAGKRCLLRFRAMKRGVLVAIAGAGLLAGAVFAWTSVRQEREFRRLIAFG